MPIGRIVVGVDGSSHAQRALRWAAELAEGTDAEVIAVHVLGLLESVGGHIDAAEPHKDEVRRHFEQEWCRPLADAGVRYRTEMPYGSPVSTLIETVQRERADLVVVGSRGTGGFSGLLLGSTGLQLAEHAPCPVTIIPPAA